jgi:hypothetical protein
VLGALIGLFGANAIAVETSESGMITSINRTSVAPVIDGVLDDAVWANAVVVDDFHQINPQEYGEPSEKTEVYLLFDSDAIYVGARMFDGNASGISASMLRQGASLRWEDRLKVILDPFNNKRSGYEFEVNSNGVRGGGLYKGEQVDRDWEGIFEVASQRDAEGWTTEFRIPFKTLSFTGDGDWGLNLVRVISRKQEMIGWSSRNRTYGPAVSGTLTGLTDLSQGVGLDIVPSVSVVASKSYSPGDDDLNVEPSLDVFYKITPALNGALTLNTDFSATEVDNRQVDLSRFSLFFPDKRAFFLRESDIFEFGGIGGGNNNSTFARPDRENGRPYFSRRIGLGPGGTPVDIDAGGKLSGRIGRWNIGAMALRQAEFENVEATDIFVARISANVLQESSVGMILTNGDPRTNLDNTLVGVDYLYKNSRLSGGRSVEAEVWYQSTDTDNLSGDSDAFGFSINSPNRTGWRGSIGAREIQQNFNPALGFVSRPGVRQYQGEVGYTHRPNSGRIRSVLSGIDLQRVDVIDGALQSQSILLRLAEFENQTGDELFFRHELKKENLLAPFEISPGITVPAGEYSFADTEISVETGQQRKLDINVSFRSGEFFDGDIISAVTKVGWRPSIHFRGALSLEFDDVDLPQGKFITRLITSEFDVVFSSTLSWVNLIQYDNVSDSIGISSRLHWNPQAGRNAFLVLNHNLVERPLDREFHSETGDLTVKIDYTFRY